MAYNLNKTKEVIDSVLTFGDNARIVNGIIKGNGQGGATAAVPGTDYTTPQTLNAAISEEATAREAADNALQANIAAEAAARISADNAITANLSKEVSARERTDRSLEMLWKATQGIAYTEEESVSTDYEKPIPSGTVGFELNEVGGKTKKSKNLVKGLTITDTPINTYASLSLARDFESTLIGGKTYTLSSFAYSSNGAAMFNQIRLCLGSTLQYSFRPYRSITTTKQTLTMTFTPTENVTFNWVEFQNGSNADTVTIINVQLEEGSTATDYEPYFAGLKSADVESVVSKGKNLLDLYNTTTFSATSKVFNVNLPVGTYTFSCDDSESKRVRIEYGTGSYVDIINWAVSKTATFVATAPIEGIRINKGNTFELADMKCQLEHGESETSYAPYSFESRPIPDAIKALPGYGLGISDSVRNYVSYKKQTFRKMKSVDLGTLNWEIVNAAFRSVTPIDGDIKIGLCSKYGFNNIHSSITSLLSDKSFGFNTGKYVVIRDDAFTSVADFKASLNGVILHYEATEGGEDYSANLYTQMCDVVDFANANITYNASNSIFAVPCSGGSTNLGIGQYYDVICSRDYAVTYSRYSTDFPSVVDKRMFWSRDASTLLVKDSAYTDVASFKAAGGMACYKLATPLVTDITDLLSEFDNGFVCEAGGSITFEQDDTIKIPVPNRETFVVKTAEAI